MVLARRQDTNARDRAKSNPVWIDAHGAVREEFLQEAIVAWERGDVPPMLRGQRLLGLDYAAIMDGIDTQTLHEQRLAIQTRYPRKYDGEELIHNPELSATFDRHMQEWKNWRQSNAAYQRVYAVFHALRDLQDIGRPAVLFIDHFHRILGGDFERFPLDLAPTLKPLLARCQIQLWGACTLSEYRDTVEHDASMQRRFQEILLPSRRII
ncbi:MAG TPA: hypothetical protein VGP82_10560 [Ktedonobacterales bacterium]|nr:hypothetical protein [Ktedonobacterales bacterium]